MSSDPKIKRQSKRVRTEGESVMDRVWQRAQVQLATRVKTVNSLCVPVVMSECERICVFVCVSVCSDLCATVYSDIKQVVQSHSVRSA